MVYFHGQIKLLSMVWGRTLCFMTLTSYFVCKCIRTWQSVAYKNEVTVTLTLNINMKLSFFSSCNGAEWRTAQIFLKGSLNAQN